MQLPSEVKIGPVTYEIREEARTAVEGNYGSILYSDSLITLMPGQSPVQKQITLWHEMLHGILRAAGEIEHDEKVIISLSHGIVQLLQENPALAAA